MYILIAGGGKVGANLARTLMRKGREVTLIEQRRDRFEQLEHEFEHQVQLGDAIVREAERSGADLIVLGSAPRWRRQSRFFSPTVEYVLRKAPCEVLVVAFPQGALEEDGAGP